MRPRLLPRFVLWALALALSSAPAWAEGPNLAPQDPASPGSASQLVLAQRAYAAAQQTGEVLALIAAIRLARGVTLRPATGWERTVTGSAAPDAPQGRRAAADPASAAAVAMAQNLAGDDPDLQDLVYGLDAQAAQGRSQVAVQALSDLAPGQVDRWRLPLFGLVAAEIALIGDGDGPLGLTVEDEGGTLLCTRVSGLDPGLCRLTPARNGFFTVTVTNPGTTVNSYRLLAN